MTIPSLHHWLNSQSSTITDKGRLKAQFSLYQALKADETLVYPKWFMPWTWHSLYWNIAGIYSILILLAFSLYSCNIIPIG